jgi:transposase
MDERLRFVARLLEGEKMAELCREFDISRGTGNKIFTRCKDQGLEALCDRSWRPVGYANRSAPPVQDAYFCRALRAAYLASRATF